MWELWDDRAVGVQKNTGNVKRHDEIRAWSSSQKIR
jgi:hypothetical protein